MMICPACKQRAIGKVGADQYYCWDCCVEFELTGQDVRIFSVEVDGSLTQYDPLQTNANLNDAQGVI